MPEKSDLTDDAAARPGIADRLGRMIRVETVSAELEARGTGAFDEFQLLLAELYPLVHSALERELIEPLGLVYRWPARDAGADSGQPVVLMAHWDVVPASGQDWKLPPFSGEVSDGAVQGRGALDDKGHLCVLLEAVENLLAEGFAPARTVYLCLGGDEEVFGASGAAIAEALRDRGIVPWLVLDEGGAVTEVPFPGVEGMFAMIGLGEKGVATLELSTSGTEGHPSAPPDLTAVTRLSRGVGRLSHNPFTPRMPRTVRQTFAALAGHATGPAKPLLGLATRVPWLLGRLLVAAGGETAAMVRTTVAPTMLAAGTAPNVLPGSARAIVNVRVNLGETVDHVRRRIERAVHDPEVKVRVVEGYDPTPESPTDCGQFGLLEKAVRVAFPDTPVVPYVTMAATDARHWHRFAPAVYRFSPLPMTAAERASIHGADERVSIEGLRRGELFYRVLLRELA